MILGDSLCHSVACLATTSERSSRQTGRGERLPVILHGTVLNLQGLRPPRCVQAMTTAIRQINKTPGPVCMECVGYLLEAGHRTARGDRIQRPLASWGATNG